MRQRPSRLVRMLFALAFVTSLTLGPAASSAKAQAGILYVYVGWYAAMYLPGEYIKLDLLMQSEGITYDQQEATGYEAANGTVDEYFNPRPTNRTVTFHGDAYYEDFYSGWILFATADDEQIVLNAGPEEIDVQYDAFIPHNWMGVPLDPLDIFSVAAYASMLGLPPTPPTEAIITAADNRGFGYTYGFADDPSGGTTARAAIYFTLRNPAYSTDLMAHGPYTYTVNSERFDAGTSLTDWYGSGCGLCAFYGEGSWTGGGTLTWSALTDWTDWPPEKIDSGHASRDSLVCDSPDYSNEQIEGYVTIEMKCDGAPYFPLHSAGPLISVDFSFTLKLVVGQAQIHWSVDGCHDPFPAFEAYLITNGIAHEMYTASDNQNPFGMFVWCTTTASRSGSIFFGG